MPRQDAGLIYRVFKIEGKRRLSINDMNRFEIVTNENTGSGRAGMAVALNGAYGANC